MYELGLVLLKHLSQGSFSESSSIIFVEILIQSSELGQPGYPDRARAQGREEGNLYGEDAGQYRTEHPRREPHFHAQPQCVRLGILQVPAKAHHKDHRKGIGTWSCIQEQIYVIMNVA